MSQVVALWCTTCVYKSCDCVVQEAFSEEGLNRLLGELVKDGEVHTASVNNKDKREDDHQSLGSRKSQFNQFLQEWTWGQVRDS